MTTIATLCDRLAEYAPLELAEEWDNVGLLVGDPAAQVRRVLVCLTLSPSVVEEALTTGANLVITHHPLPFRALKRITTDSIEGRSLWRLVGGGIGVYSAHTAYDSAALGVNEQIARGLGLSAPEPLLPTDSGPRTDGAGVGRIGTSESDTTLADLADRARVLFGIDTLRAVGNPTQLAGRVAIACGSGGSLLQAALDAGCDTFVTGEASFHDCLHAESCGAALLLAGHYASERFAMERLAERLKGGLTGVEVEISQAESDPIGPI